MTTCRCGYVGNDTGHPCHGNGYTCKKLAKFRLYAQPGQLGSLAGAQTKLSMVSTWACDDCWAGWQRALARGRALSAE